MMAGNPFGGLFGAPGTGTDLFSGIANLLNTLLPMIIMGVVVCVGLYICYKLWVQPKLAEAESKSIKKFGLVGPTPIGQ